MCKTRVLFAFSERTKSFDFMINASTNEINWTHDCVLNWYFWRNLKNEIELWSENIHWIWSNESNCRSFLSISIPVETNQFFFLRFHCKSKISYATVAWFNIHLSIFLISFRRWWWWWYYVPSFDMLFFHSFSFYFCCSHKTIFVIFLFLLDVRILLTDADSVTTKSVKKKPTQNDGKSWATEFYHLYSYAFSSLRPHALAHMCCFVNAFSILRLFIANLKRSDIDETGNAECVSYILYCASEKVRCDRPHVDYDFVDDIDVVSESKVNVVTNLRLHPINIEIVLMCACVCLRIQACAKNDGRECQKRQSWVDEND